MLGWEYPPHNSGGLGEACQGLTKALSDSGHQIYFTLPFVYGQSVGHMQLFEFPVGSPDQIASWQHLGAYDFGLSLDNNSQRERQIKYDGMAGAVQKYSDKLINQAQILSQNTDVIHAHDWMTLPAAIKLKKLTGKPVVAHVHSTEADRVVGVPGNYVIEKIEAEGLRQVDRIIAVSLYTKNILTHHYGLDPHKIDVVHNGSDLPILNRKTKMGVMPHQPMVVFMGRLTGQKGLPYFLQLAQKVLQSLPQTLFVIAGDGDMYHEILFKVAANGLTGKILFSGFVRDVQKDKLLSRADVFVMPSLSEPFGLVALEAAAKRTPVVMSDRTGVGEVLSGSVQIPLADLDGMAAAIVKLLTVDRFRQEVTNAQLKSLPKINWPTAAQGVAATYQRTLTAL